MSGGGDIPYDAVIMLALFLMAQWYAARLAAVVKLPTIAFEIGIGCLFGPHGLDLIPDFSHTFSPLRLLGLIGVGLVIFESGMHLDIQKVANWDIGPHVVAVACMGTLFPIILGMLFMNALGADIYPAGLAAGFALAPTSVGISLTLLGRAKQLNSRNGQIIMSAAFLDDIFSIICLVVLTNLGHGSLEPVNHIVLPLIFSFGFVGLGAVGSIYMPLLTPVLFDDTMPAVQALLVPNRSMPAADEMQLFLMICLYLGCSFVGDLIGSALLGGFVAGMLFANVPRSHLVWDKQFKRINRWLLRIFFSCTVAFSININDLISVDAFWKGLIIGLVPCLLSKGMSGYFTGPGRWVVGVAMMARGEFAYLVAEAAHDLEFLSGAQYAVVVWALLWATLIAPFAFDKVLKAFVVAEFKEGGSERSKRIGGTRYSGEVDFIIHFFGLRRPGMVRDVTEGLFSMGFDVKKSLTENGATFGMGTFEVYPRQAVTLKNKYGEEILADPASLRQQQKFKMATDLTDDKLDEIAHHLKEIMDDENAQITFESSLRSGDSSASRMLEIQVLGKGHRSTLDRVSRVLEDECELVIVQCMAVDTDNYDLSKEYSVFYCTKPEPEDTTAVPAAAGAGSGTGGSTKGKSLARVDSVMKQISPKDLELEMVGGTNAIAVPKGAGSDDASALKQFRAASTTMMKDAGGAVSAMDADISSVKAKINALFAELDLLKCEVLVRSIHEDAVVYIGETHKEFQFQPDNTFDFDDNSAENSVIQVPRMMTGSKIEIIRKVSGANIIADRKLTFDPTDFARLQAMKKKKGSNNV